MRDAHYLGKVRIGLLCHIRRKKSVKFVLSYSFVIAEIMSKPTSYMTGKFIMCSSQLKWLIKFFLSMTVNVTNAYGDQ